MMRRITPGRVALATILVVSLLFSFAADCEAKKKGKGKGKKKGSVDVASERKGGADQLRCGVCLVSVSEMRKDLQDTDGDNLDLRWGLTAEVEEGKPKRIGKVIPYHRSELRSIEVMESLCEGVMQNYTTTEEVPGEVRLKLLPEKDRQNLKMLMNAFSPVSPLYKNEQVKQEMQAQQKKHCEELLEAREDDITELIKAGKSRREFEETLCYGSAAAPCGEERLRCRPGAVNKVSGKTPCFLCPIGSYQDEEGQTACKSCPANQKTPAKGTTSSSDCGKNPPPEDKDEL